MDQWEDEYMEDIPLYKKDLNKQYGLMYNGKRVNSKALMLYNVDGKRHQQPKAVVHQQKPKQNFNIVGEADNAADAVKKLQARNQQRMKFMYDDGTVRNFGQTIRAPDNREKLVFAGTDREFVYEGARDRPNPNAPKRRRPYEKFINGDARRVAQEDTRSLYDDPRLQSLRSTNTRKLMMKIDQDCHLEKVEGCQWEPITANYKIPESYYMLEKFTQNVGHQNLDKKLIETEYDAFKLFYCDEVYDTILKASEARYNEYYMEAVYEYCNGFLKTAPKYMDLNFHERELDAYFSVQLFFGVVRLSNVRDYFRQAKKCVDRRQSQYQFVRDLKTIRKMTEADNKYIHFVQQKMASIISFQRFQEIKKHMCIWQRDAKIRHPDDNMYRLRDHVNDFNAKFKKYFYPDEYLCIDEGMIPFGGKAKFKVYNPDKPTQWGIKEFLLCDAVRCYTLHILIYHGQSTWDLELKQKMLLTDQSDLSSRTLELVLSLLKGYEGVGHKIVMDNYYTSWQLMKELKTRGFGAVGTMRHNRTGLDKEDLLKDHFQQIYEDSYKRYAFYINHTKDCVLAYFQGTADKEVAMITNYLDHTLNEDHKFQFAKKHYYCPNSRLPYIISTYNKYKGGVDRRNGFMVNYRAKFTCRKWWFAIFERFFETAVYNAFVIYKNIKRVHLTYKRGLYRDFRIVLMSQLQDRYKEYNQQIKNGTIKPPKQRLLQPHTFVVGEVELLCQECGATTFQFCQECSIIERQNFGICLEETSLKCFRFHQYSEFLLDRDKVVIDKRFRYASYDPMSMAAFYREVAKLQEEKKKLRQERTHLITEHHDKKQLSDSLDQILNLSKKMKKGQCSKPEEELLIKLLTEQVTTFRATQEAKKELAKKENKEEKITKTEQLLYEESSRNTQPNCRKQIELDLDKIQAALEEDGDGDFDEINYNRSSLVYDDLNESYRSQKAQTELGSNSKKKFQKLIEKTRLDLEEAKDVDEYGDEIRPKAKRTRILKKDYDVMTRDNYEDVLVIDENDG